VEATSTPARPSAHPSSDPPPAEEEPVEREDDVFVLKQLGKKRKRTPEPAVIDGMAAQSDEVAIGGDGETERLRAKAERKQARKEAKRAAKMSAEGTEGGIGEIDNAGDEMPFDYASAPSMLNPPRESREKMRERRKKEINPYAKSMDAPKGLPRVQKERAGRSMTYKS